MYCTTKIHKAGSPMLTIVDYTGSIGYQTSKALAEILAPLVGTSEHHFVNSKHLTDKMATVIVTKGDIFSSHDVASLFTNTLIEKCLDTIKTSRTPQACAHYYILQFSRQIYRQIFGAALGSPVSAIVAHLFVEWLEKKAHRHSTPRSQAKALAA